MLLCYCPAKQGRYLYQQQDPSAVVSSDQGRGDALTSTNGYKQPF